MRGGAVVSRRERTPPGHMVVYSGPVAQECPGIVLTAHAAHVLEQRAIRVEWIELAIAAPVEIQADPRDRSLLHALWRVAERDGRMLRVVYDPAVQPYRIVTAYFDRRIRRRE